MAVTEYLKQKKAYKKIMYKHKYTKTDLDLFKKIKFARKTAERLLDYFEITGEKWAKENADASLDLYFMLSRKCRFNELGEFKNPAIDEILPK